MIRPKQGLSGAIRIAALLGFVLQVSPAFGQAEMASAARGFYRQAVQAYHKQDYAAARDLMAQAQTAWPSQSAYVIGLATMWARLGDSAATARWLNQYADLGLGQDLSENEDFAAVRQTKAVRKAMVRVAANRNPIVKSDVAFRLTEPDFFPEGITSDDSTRDFYVASVRHRKITRVQPNGQSADFVAEGRDGLCAVLGVRVDAVRRLLWATTAGIPQMAGYTLADSGRGGLFAFDLASGALRHRIWLPPVAGGHTLGDLLVTPNGDVYASDSQNPALYLVRVGTDSVEQFLTHPQFRSLQGLVLAPNGRALLLADYSHGLFRIDLASKAVQWLGFPAGVTVLGLDGLARDRQSLLAIQNGVAPARVVRLRLDAEAGRVLALQVLDRHLPIAAQPTIGTLAGGDFYYVANSQWDQYQDDGGLRQGAVLEAPVILRLRVR